MVLYLVLYYRRPKFVTPRPLVNAGDGARSFVCLRSHACCSTAWLWSQGFALALPFARRRLTAATAAAVPGAPLRPPRAPDEEPVSGRSYRDGAARPAQVDAQGLRPAAAVAEEARELELGLITFSSPERQRRGCQH
jgi:hypothetical protein